jgi:hypothetical protein
MTQEERMETVSRLRFTMQRNNRLRLEFLALLSKLFRDHQVEIEDELLARLVLAAPEELPDWEGEGEGDVDVDKLQTLTPKLGSGKIPPQPSASRPIPPQPSATRPTPPKPTAPKPPPFKPIPPQPSATRPVPPKPVPPQPSAVRPGYGKTPAKKGKKSGRKK